MRRIQYNGKFTNLTISITRNRRTWQFVADDRTCGYSASAVRDIEPGEELFAFYAEDYFQDVEGGCPCGSCKQDLYEMLESKEEERKQERKQQDAIDKEIIAGKKKERNKRRREKREARIDDN